MGFILSSLLTLYVSTRVGRTESELEPVTVPIRNTGWKESDIRISIGIRIRIAGHYPGPRIRIGVRIMVRFGTDNSRDMQYWMEKLRYQNQNQRHSKSETQLDDWLSTIVELLSWKAVANIVEQLCSNSPSLVSAPSASYLLVVALVPSLGADGSCVVETNTRTSLACTTMA